MLDPMWSSMSGSKMHRVPWVVLRVTPALALAACGSGCGSAPSASSDGGGSRSDAASEADSSTAGLDGGPDDSAQSTGAGDSTSSSGCAGNVSGAVTGTFSCTVTLRTSGGKETLQLLLGQASGSIASLAIALSPASASFAPGSYAAASLSPDSDVLLSSSSPAANYLTHGGSPPSGSSVSLALTSVDLPPASFLSPASGTHGTMDAVLIRSDIVGPTVMLHASF